MLIIAHRGASGDRPEHSLSAHSLAIEQGADVIEPDLVFSADGQLLVRHDLGLARTTDIAAHPEFAELAVTTEAGTDWPALSLSWEQLSRLRCRQPWPQRPTQRDGIDSILRLQDLLQLAATESHRRDRKIIVYAETKHPAWHRQHGFDFADAVAAAWTQQLMHRANVELWIQSFEWDVLAQLKQRLGVPVFALVDQHSQLKPSELAGRCDGVGIAKSLIDPRQSSGRKLLDELLRVNLQVHAWTFRHDQPGPGWDNAETELKAYIPLPLAAVFCDFPGRARRLRDGLQ